VGGSGAGRSMLINGLGGVATGITLVVVLVAKFTSGAWVSVLLIGGLVYVMLWVRRHYGAVARETECTAPLEVGTLGPPIVVLPIQEWSKTSQRALQFALTLSPDVRALHVATEEETNALQEKWNGVVEAPVKEAGGTPPRLITLPSPFRLVIRPILQYVLKTQAENPDRQIAVIVPELVEKHWYHYPLHNQRAELLKALLLVSGSKQIVLINVPWYLEA